MSAMPRHVSFNGRHLEPARLSALEMYAQRFASGAYWYDRRSGLWGKVGHGASGRLMSGLPLGRMHPHCSRQDGPSTGVFLNGREITEAELAHLRQVSGKLSEGRYTLDADGHMFPEEGGMPVHVFVRASYAA